MNTPTAILKTARPNFLVLTPVCVALGVTSAWHTHDVLDVGTTLIILLGAVLAHAAVNMLNEYEDFASGLDSATQRTPFSGGTGTLPANPEYANAVRIGGLAALTTSALIGLFLALQAGWGLLPLGLLGVITVAAYTRWITRNWLACLVAPGLGFGPLMVMGTAFVLAGEYSVHAALVSLPPFFLVSNLLLLNQFPDAGPDKDHGRRHLLVIARNKDAAVVYCLFAAAAFAAIPAAVALGYLPPWVYLGLIPLPLAAWIGWIVLRNADDMDRVLPAMGPNVIISLATPALIAAGVALG